MKEIILRYKHIFIPLYIVQAILISFFFVRVPNSEIYKSGVLTNISEILTVDTTYEKGDINSIGIYVVSEPTIIEVIASAFSSETDFRWWSESYTEYRNSMTDEEYANIGYAQKNSSITNSVIYGYEAAEQEIDYDINVYINYVNYNYISDSNFTEGKYITKIDDQDITNLVSAKSALEIVDCITVYTAVFEVTSDFETYETITLTAEMRDDSCIFGFSISDVVSFNSASPEISISSYSARGSSAGFMQTLSIYNQLTETDITSGKKIAGSGTIDLEGNVGIIGGTTFKVITALNNDTDIFFIPSDNYEEAIEAYNKYSRNRTMQIVKVDTFEEALAYLAGE